MKKIILTNLLVAGLATAAHAGLFAGVNVGTNSVNPKLNISGLNDTSGSYSENVNKAKKNAFDVSANVGYRFGGDKLFFDASLGFGQLIYSSEQNSFDFNGKLVDPFANAGTNILTLKTKASYDVVVGVAAGTTFGKMGALVGLNVHATQFSVQLNNTLQAAASEINATNIQEQKKLLIGFEPTLGAEYRMNKVSLLANVGYTVYGSYKTGRLYYKSSADPESAYLTVKPTVLSFKVGLRYSF